MLLQLFHLVWYNLDRKLVRQKILLKQSGVSAALLLSCKQGGQSMQDVHIKTRDISSIFQHEWDERNKREIKRSQKVRTIRKSSGTGSQPKMHPFALKILKIFTGKVQPKNFKQVSTWGESLLHLPMSLSTILELDGNGLCLLQKDPCYYKAI